MKSQSHHKEPMFALVHLRLYYQFLQSHKESSTPASNNELLKPKEVQNILE